MGQPRHPSLLLFGILLIGHACAVHHPGNRVTPEVAAELGCDYQSVLDRSHELNANRPTGWLYPPQVGWDACAVMAAAGAPIRVAVHGPLGSLTMTWWYHEQYRARHVTMEYVESAEPCHWVVTRVAW